jgi:hypothetical protein
MQTAAYFRRQAGFLLRLGQSCTDKSMVRNLELMAAEFHQKALEVEFGLERGDLPDRAGGPAARWH